MEKSRIEEKMSKTLVDYRLFGLEEIRKKMKIDKSVLSIFLFGFFFDGIYLLVLVK